MTLDLKSLRVRRRLLYAVAASLSFFVALILAVLSFLGIQLPLDLGSMTILGTVVAFAFPALVDMSYLNWRRSVDEMIPQLLADVTSRVRTGFSLTRSLELASESDYGPLTGELRRMKAQMSWGVSFESALTAMTERVDSNVARRAFGILLEADRAGGRVEDMLDAVQKHTAELSEIEEERRAVLRPYTITIYVSILIFLTVAVVLIDAFFGPVYRSQLFLGSGLGAFGGTGAIDPSMVKSSFLQLGLVESVVGGLGAGKLGEGSLVAGIKHVVILVAITIVAFEVFA